MRKESDAKLVSELADKIYSKIVGGDLGPGSPLRQEALAREFDVSRTPIREALKQLEAKGVISHARGYSAVVRTPSSREIREKYQIRAELEGLAAQLAAQWITDPQLEELRTIHSRFARAVKGFGGEHGAVRRSSRGTAGPSSNAAKDWIETNAAFHSAIHVASNNLSLRRHIDDLNLGYIRSVMVTSTLGMDLHRVERNIRHHQAILDALSNRDPVQSRRAMSEHIIESGDFLVAWFENHGTGP
jgi:DNA-binding GntR family transcriptional regulator